MDLMSGPLYWAILALAGAACGFLNTLASSGSAVTLPLLVLLGMPEGAANATNRLPVLIGSMMATVTFARKGKVDWSAAWKLVIPAAAGAAVGAFLAELLPNKQMGYLITGAVLLALIMLFTKMKSALAKDTHGPGTTTPLALALMFGVGVWLGLIVLDGATYLLLILILVCSYALPEANALKGVIAAATTFVAIAMFWSKGDIWLVEGLVLGAGSIVGGHLGAELSNHPDARKWAFRMLVVAIGLELINLGWHYSGPWRAEI
ncbi:MAG: sulfite exporter TauE/SafE family protein [Bauldia sp.]